LQQRHKWAQLIISFDAQSKCIQLCSVWLCFPQSRLSGKRPETGVRTSDYSGRKNM
jgi:hypothetical protein